MVTIEHDDARDARYALRGSVAELRRKARATTNYADAAMFEAEAQRLQAVVDRLSVAMR